MEVTGSDQRAPLSERKKELLAQLLAGKARLNSPANQPILRLAPGSALPLSEAQQRLVFVEHLYPGNAFNGSLTLEHVGDLDVSRLETAFRAVVNRHDVLRTNAVLTDNGAVGRLCAGPDPSLEFTDLSDLPEAQRRAAAIRQANAIVARRFDIFSTCPLVSLSVLRMGAGSHVITLSMHMFVIDAPSGAILVRELVEAYERLGLGLQAFETPLPYQYADYVAWAAVSQTPPRPQALRHWVQQLAGCEDALQLPTDRGRRTEQGFDARRFPFAIAPPLAGALKAMARSAGVSFYVVLLAALQTTLFRHSGQRGVSVGAWTIRRNEHNKDLIGPFVNPLVYRSVFEEDDSFSSLLDRLKSVAASANAYSDLTFERAVAAVQPGRDIRLNPLFQVHFILQDTSFEEIRGFSLSSLDAEVGAAGGYDVELLVRDLKRGVEGHFECNAYLFDDVAVAQLCRRFMKVLAEVVRAPGLPIADIAFEDVETDEPPASHGPAALEDLLGEIDRVDAERCAATGFNGETSYGEFRGLVAALEDWIEGSIPDAAVAIIGGRSPCAAAAMVAALRLGRPFAMVAGADAVVQLKRLGSETALVCILGEDLDPGVTASLRLNWSCATTSDLGEAPPPRRLSRTVLPTAPAYFAMTSGSTSAPRVVAISREGLADVLGALVEAYRVTKEDRVLQLANPGVDVAIEETLTALIAGSALVFPRRWPGGGLDGLAQDLEDYGVTLANLPSSLWQAWAEQLRQTGRAPPASLTKLVIGSETVDFAPVRVWQETFGSRIRLIHAYGATEAAITCCLYVVPVDIETLRNLPRLPLGRPIGGFRLSVRDRRGRLVPSGVVGELNLEGPGVAAGYLADPTATSHRFHDGRFRTGDLVRARRDGAFEFLGRIAATVKIRGRWFDLRQIHDDVRKISGVLAADVKVSGSGMTAALDVRVWPAALDPAEVVALRGQLAKLGSEGDGLPFGRIEIVGVTPGTASRSGQGSAIATQLSRLWSDVLSGKAPDPDHSLFEQGVVSLDCMRLVAKATSEDLHISIADIYECQSITEQADLLTFRTNRPFGDATSA